MLVNEPAVWQLDVQVSKTVGMSMNIYLNLKKLIRKDIRTALDNGYVVFEWVCFEKYCMEGRMNKIDKGVAST